MDTLWVYMDVFGPNLAFRGEGSWSLGYDLLFPVYLEINWLYFY